MLKKIISKLSNDATLYTLSSLIYSFSTYVVTFLIPYKLNVKSMADFSATLNTVMMLSFIFEFGVVTSFLRFNQLYKTTKYVNAYIQLFIFLLMFVIAESFLGDYLDKFFGLQNVDVSQSIVYLSTFAVLSWVYFKNIFLANKEIKTIFNNALILTGVRVATVAQILLSNKSYSVDEIYLLLFILPFVLVIFYNLKYDLLSFKESLKFIGNPIHRDIFFKRLKSIVIFAITTYFISILYVYATRYALIYLTKENATKLVAELGYAMSLGGIVVIFSVSIRSYIISKFNISNVEAIKEYIAKVKSYAFKFIIFSLIFSAAVGLFVELIKPSYMSSRAALFTAIMVETLLLSAYLGLFSVLSKTFNFNNLELRLNILRLILVVLSVHLFLPKYPLTGWSLLNLSLVGVELYFAKIVLDRINKDKR